VEKLKIYAEDADILVVYKPAGVDAQESRGLGADMVSLLKNHLAEEARGAGGKLSTKSSTAGAPPYLAVIHRLDRQVAGIMVYAKNRKAAAALSAGLSGDSAGKIYLAVLCGKPVDNSGELVDFLVKDGRANLTRAVDKDTPGAKKAVLRFEVLGSIPDPDSGVLTLVRVHLVTGRHHQIRVQFASRGLPLYGDPKYNPAFRERRGINPALCAVELTFRHPRDGRQRTYSARAEGEAFDRFRAAGILKESGECG
jgi:23S rRNA pseudouridine1911/1915/1917 synthase